MGVMTEILETDTSKPVHIKPKQTLDHLRWVRKYVKSTLKKKKTAQPPMYSVSGKIHKDNICWEIDRQREDDRRRWVTVFLSTPVAFHLFQDRLAPPGGLTQTHTHTHNFASLLFMKLDDMCMLSFCLSLYSWIHVILSHIFTSVYLCKCVWQCLSVCLPKPRQEHWRKKQITVQNLQPRFYLDKSPDSAACQPATVWIFYYIYIFFYLHLSLYCFNVRASWSLADKTLSFHFKFTLSHCCVVLLFYTFSVCVWECGSVSGL